MICASPSIGTCGTASIGVIDSNGQVHELEADANNAAEVWLDGGAGIVSIHLPPQHNSRDWQVNHVIPTLEGHEIVDHPETLRFSITVPLIRSTLMSESELIAILASFDAPT